MEKSDTGELIEYIVSVGKELVDKSGKIEDIGVKNSILQKRILE